MDARARIDQVAGGRPAVNDRAEAKKDPEGPYGHSGGVSEEFAGHGVITDQRPLISGMILAAGTSSRLGWPKQLLDLGGEPLLRHTVRNAKASTLDEVILVLGSRAEEIARAVGDLGQRNVVNQEFVAGQSTSLIAGIAAIAPDTLAVMVLLGDQPLVSTAAIDRMVAASRAGHMRIVQATYGGVPGNPVLFRRDLFAELLDVTGDEGARGVIRQHRGDIHPVEVGDVAQVVAVDTDEDYINLRLLRSNDV